MTSRLWQGALWAAAGVLVLSACTRRLPETTTPPPSTVAVGACADPNRDGVVSESPDLMRADRDLNGDGRDEIVVADRSLCNRAGNCQWNVFTDAGECPRYLGTIGAAAIERLETRGEDGFFDLRGWWQLAGEGRMLMQEYSVKQGGYRVIEAMPCTTEPGGRMVCGEDATAGGAW
jgi:hypothetical protein